MAGRGPAPGANPNRKDPSQRRRRNAPVEMEELPAEGYRGEFPRLPVKWRDERLVTTTDENGTTSKVRVVQITYLKATREWYEAWARSPMATRFTQVEWNRLLMIAPLIDQHHRRPTNASAGEIRLQETLLGATLMDRQRVRLKIAAAAPDAEAAGGLPATVTRLWAVDPEK